MNYLQQDSIEFLNILLNALHEDLSGQSSLKEKFFISKLFHCETGSEVKCLGKCGKTLVINDSFTFLALCIPESQQVKGTYSFRTKSTQTCSLYDCFDEFNKTEYIGEDGQWFCEHCNKLTNIEKKLSLSTLPQILIIQLKRFSSDPQSNTKISTLVEYPLKNFDLSAYVTNPKKGRTIPYDLVAVSNHWGSLSGGHYTAYGKIAQTNDWYDYNDKRVEQVDISQVKKNQDAYILIYQQQQITYKSRAEQLQSTLD